MAENAMAIRMCKKVAQLTRVIYHLNTVNEDAVIERQKIKKQHEEDMRALRQQYQKRVFR